jgi:hypothetical protein
MRPTRARRAESRTPVVGSHSKEEILQDEPQNSGRDARGDPISGRPEEDNTLEAHPNLITVIQQSPVIIDKLPYDEFVAPRDQTGEWI